MSMASDSPGGMTQAPEAIAPAAAGRGRDPGADASLTKPFTQKELMAAVNTRLDKQAEMQRQSDKPLNELRGNIPLALPHELRTPLNGIMGLAQIMIEDYATMPPAE